MSSEKFQAKIKISDFLLKFNSLKDNIGIPNLGKYLPTLYSLSSTINSISLEDNLLIFKSNDAFVGEP